MEFKYHAEIESIPDCPPADYKSQKLRAFRFVFGDSNHQNNFHPVLVIKPKRKNNRRFRRNSAKCQGYGLSLFNSLENAQKKYLDLIDSYPTIHQTIGTHIAEGVIEESDGVVSEVNRDGHLTLHESESADLTSKFALVMEVYNDEKDNRTEAR